MAVLNFSFCKESTHVRTVETQPNHPLEILPLNTIEVRFPIHGSGELVQWIKALALNLVY